MFPESKNIHSQTLYPVFSQAVEEKYESMRSKLLLQAARTQRGDADWSRLTEQDRQRHLAQFKQQAKQMERDG